MVARPCQPPPQLVVPGIDVSSHQGTIDWEALKAQTDIQWMIARSSVGLGGDSQFARNWQGAKAAGVIRGAYHFYKGASGDGQADHMARQIAAAGGLEAGDLPPVLDLEGPDWQTVDGSRNSAPYLDDGFVIEGALRFLHRIEAISGRRPILYTGQFFHWGASQARPDLAQEFAKYPLWLGIAGSNPSCMPTPLNAAGNPFPWKEPTFWQYAIAPAGHPGIPRPNELDLDVYNGSYWGLKRFIFWSHLINRTLTLGSVGALLGAAGTYWYTEKR